MYCEKCGAELKDGEQFCHKCGAQVGNYEELDNQETASDPEICYAQSDNVGNQQADSEKKQQTEEAENETETPISNTVDLEEKTQRKRPLTAIIAVGVIAVVVIIAAIVIGTRSSSDKEVAEQEEISAVEEPIEEITEVQEPEEIEEEVLDVAQLTEEQQNMIGPMGALILSYPDLSLGEEITMHWTGDESDWVPLNNLIDNWGDTYEYSDIRPTQNNSLAVSRGFLLECASSMYTDFDEILPDLPEPSVIRTGVWKKQASYYYFAVSDRGDADMNFSIRSWENHSDGSVSTQMNEVDDQGRLVAVYQFELEKDTNKENVYNPVFVYSVLNMKKVQQAVLSDEESNKYILPESNTRYYTQEELSDYDADTLRLARNEIYARHGRMFDAEDLQDYFDERSWYEGTVKAEDFDEKLLNQYEKTNIETIKALEDGVAYSIVRKDASLKDADGNLLAKNSYDLIQLDGNSQAVQAINQALQDDYQRFLDTEAWRSADNLITSYDDCGECIVNATVMNNANGIFSIVFDQWFYNGDFGWYGMYGLTYSMETGKELSIRDLTDMSDEELLSEILDAVQVFADKYPEYNLNQFYEGFGKDTLQNLTIDELQTGGSTREWENEYGFAVKDDKILFLVSADVFTYYDFVEIPTDIPVVLN